MSDTPRTDTFAIAIERRLPMQEGTRTVRILMQEQVNFARKLEREVSALREKNERLQETLEEAEGLLKLARAFMAKAFVAVVIIAAVYLLLEIAARR